MTDTATALAIVAAVLFLFGVACLCVGAIYYSKAKIVHAQAEELNAVVRRNYDDAVANQRRADDILARIQEHSVC